MFAVDDRIAVSGTAVADLTHLLAELTENAVRFSPPETAVTIRVRPNRRDEGGHLLTVEDWGVGMPPDDLAEANELLAHPRDIDLAVAQRLGFHVVARLATRHRIAVSLTATPGSGITAVVVLPAALFTQTVPPGPVAPLPGGAAFDAVRPNTGASHDGFGRPQVEAGPADMHGKVGVAGRRVDAAVPDGLRARQRPGRARRPVARLVEPRDARGHRRLVGVRLDRPSGPEQRIRGRRARHQRARCERPRRQRNERHQRPRANGH